MQDNEPILLVEDDEVDAMTVRRVLRELKVSNALVHVTNGEEALGYLRDSTRPRPCLVLLDINMPRMNGIELLRIMKADEELRALPVVIMTTSTNDRDIIEAFHLSVAGYMIKPVDYRQFVETIRTIDTYWRLSRRPVATVKAASAT
ncbi:MAG: response regulator [Sedimentisphaerales bacterium]|jgi:CheY-like chemotaxis protein|nr:response regulator [Sedimentisphaerales bacterium]